MVEERYSLTVSADEQAAAGRGAVALSDTLREVDGVTAAEIRKGDGPSMDLGVIVSVIVQSGAALALARGVAAWLRARRGTTLTIERDATSGSLKAVVAGVDPEAALRIVELVRKA